MGMSKTLAKAEQVEPPFAGWHKFLDEQERTEAQMGAPRREDCPLGVSEGVRRERDRVSCARLLEILVSQLGVEPRTRRLRVCCSAN